MRGTLIQALRKSKNISQSALAKKMNVTRQTIYNWESNSSTPSENQLIEMARILEVPQEVLLSEAAIAKTEDLILECELSKENAHKEADENLHKKESGSNKKIIILSCILVFVVLVSAFVLIFPGIEVFSTNKGAGNGITQVFSEDWRATPKDMFWLILSLSLIVITVLVILIIRHVKKRKKEKKEEKGGKSK